MIRISTTDIRVGDKVRTSTTEGTVTEYRFSHTRPYMTVMASWGPTRVHMTAAGSVELLSALGKGRKACESFGRW